MVEAIKQKIESYASKPNIIEVDGVKYAVQKETTKVIDGVEHRDKLVFVKFNEEEYKEDLKVLIEAISKQTTKKELLNEILGYMDVKTLKRLVRRIKTKKPIRKQRGCLGFKIGDVYVPLID